MKKWFSVCLLTVLMLNLFSGCAYKVPIERCPDKDAVTSVQIYDLRNHEGKHNNFLDTEEPVYTVEEEKTADFLSDLQAIEFYETKLLVIAAVDPGFTFDEWTVRLNYDNGTYLIFSDNGYAELYDEAGEVIESDHGGCDQEQWDDLIEKYVPEDILNESTE